MIGEIDFMDENNEKEKKTKKQPEKEQEKKEMDKKENKKVEKKKTMLPIIIGSVLVIFLLVFSVIFSLISINNENILDNVSIMGIDVSNMSKEKAKEAVTEVITSKMQEELTLKKDDYETSLNANQINAQFDIDSAINEAYNVGRDGNIITNNYGILGTWLFGKKIECNFNFDEESLNKKIDDISSKLPGAVVQNSYYIEDDELIIVKGKPGIAIKKDELKEDILAKVKAVNKKYEITTIPTEEVEPDAINLEQIRNEIYKEPQDAYVSKNPTTVHTHVNGVDFAISIEEAQKILEQDKEEYIIPLKITVPEKTLEDLGEEAFPDELGTYTTRYDPTNYNRSNNISISAKKINGTIVMPGETFSYNQVVGERTIAEGYKEAGAYAGGRVVQDVGGGICQTSSTLYNAVLYANLEIVDRSNHQFLTSYVSAGRDATVAWGSIDFQFKNNRTYPIKIEAVAENGVCTMSIYGIKEETEYEVVIQSVVLSYIPYTTKYENDDTLEEGKEIVEQSGYTGCTSEAYKILKLNGEIVSKTLLSKDTYDPMTRIVKRGTKKTEETSTNKPIEENEEKTETSEDNLNEVKE
jgi:vancomycin resistance protein YoaR